MPLNRRFFLSLLALGPVVACSRRRGPPASRLAVGARVLCAGDSLTAGYGAGPQDSYPACLGRLSGWVTVNAGVNGATTASTLDALPAALAREHPALVLLGIGGNDFLHGVPLEQTRANLERLLDQCAGTELVLIAQPRPSALAAALGGLADHPLYAELGPARNVAVFEGGWSKVLSEPTLRSDPIHANALGYERFAAELLSWLRDAGY